MVEGRVERTRGELLHYSMESLEHEMKKAMLSVDYFVQECAARKKKVYFLEVLLRPWWRFIRAYFLRLGFLDGWQGFAIARIIAIYTFLRYLKVYQVQNEKS